MGIISNPPGITAPVNGLNFLVLNQQGLALDFRNKETKEVPNKCSLSRASSHYRLSLENNEEGQKESIILLHPLMTSSRQ